MLPTCFVYETLRTKSREWRVAKALLSPGGTSFLLAEHQARQKSKHTMSFSQAGIARDGETKYQRQFMGSLAEIFSEYFLSEFLTENGLAERFEICRYDNVRTDDFKSPEGEYDLKLIEKASARSFVIECRSSVIYNRTLQKAIEDFDIIGPYSSLAKNHEGYAHLYIRPLFFIDLTVQKNYEPHLFESLINAGKIDLYIAGGCFRSDMIRKGYYKSMQQKDTAYRVLKLMDGYDALDFKKEIAARLISL